MSQERPIGTLNYISLVTPLLIAAMVFVIHMAISAGNPVLMAAVLIAPVGLMLLARLDRCFLLFYVLTGASLSIPGAFLSLTLLDLYSMGLLCLLLVHTAVRKQQGTGRLDVPVFLIVAFLAVVVVTAGIRGVGFRQLGDSKVGGMSYVRIITILLIYVFGRDARLTTGQWKAAILGYCAMSFLPAAADLLYVMTSGRVPYLYYIVQPSSSVVETIQAMQSSTGIVRVRRLPGLSVLLAALVLFPWKGKGKLLIVLAGVAALALAGMTGFRLRIVSIAIFVGFCVAARSRSGRVLVGLRVLAGLAAGYGVLLVVSSKLPLAFQRALSWVPAIDISREAASSAGGTTVWRLELWRELLRMVPDYLLIGRGLSFEQIPLHSVYRIPGIDRSQIGWAIITHNYHHGTLGLLVDLGLIGMLLSLTILATVTLRNWRRTQQPWEDEERRWLFTLVFARFATMVFVFVFIYGDLRDMLPEVFLLMLFLNRMADTGESATPHPLPAHAES